MKWGIVLACLLGACKRPVCKPGKFAYQENRQGYVHCPKGSGPHPAIVYNHGSEREPPTFGGQGRFYAPRGFVVLAPHRAGHGASVTAAPYPEEAFANLSGRPEALVEVLEEQLQDVLATVEYARALPYVDPTRVFIAGCSLGGVLALLAAEHGEGIRGVVNFSGGALAWSVNPALRTRMRRAAKRAKVPVMLIQAENDFDTTPSRVLAEILGRNGRLALFPAHGVGQRAGHAFCAGGERPPWGPAVSDFLSEIGGFPRDRSP